MLCKSDKPSIIIIIIITGISGLRLSRCLGLGECLYSFIHIPYVEYRILLTVRITYIRIIY